MKFEDIRARVGFLRLGPILGMGLVFTFLRGLGAEALELT